jgi:Cof subfamily protein (haloacid dehalogenase superfamily)
MPHDTGWLPLQGTGAPLGPTRLIRDGCGARELGLASPASGSLPSHFMQSPRLLLALDMDGTLLRDDKTIAPADVEAIRSASRHGILVTLATGRLTAGTLPTARELGLSAPLVCADGAVLLDPIEGRTLLRRSIVPEQATAAVRSLLDHELVPFVFLADTIHCDAAGERHRAIVETWSREVVVHPSLGAASAWQEPDCVSMTVGIGTEADVLRAHAHLSQAHAGALDTVYFRVAGMPEWAVRSLPGGCDKSDMLARLAERLGIPAARVVAVGDWLNDLGMFKYAGRSFAMGHAPDVVREAATDVLRATSAEGGGIAEAIAALLAVA